MGSSYSISLEACQKKLENTWQQVSDDSLPGYIIGDDAQTKLSGFKQSTDENLQSSDTQKSEKKSAQSYIDDEETIELLYECLSADERAFKYVVLTAILAKSVNQSIHMRSIKKRECDLDGAYSGRRICHKVIVSWEALIGEPLGGSREPYKNTAIDHPKISKSNPNRNKKARDRAYDLLERLNSKINNDSLCADCVLKEALLIVDNLPKQLVEYDRIPVYLSYQEVINLFETYLSESDGGTRLEAVTAGVFRVYYDSISKDDRWTVENGHANAPDEQADAAGDVEIAYECNRTQAVQVKDQKVTVQMVVTAESKIMEYDLNDYLIVYGSDIDQKVRDYIRDSNADIKLVSKTDLYSICKTFNHEQRSQLLDEVWNILKEMNAPPAPRDGWTNLMDDI